MRATPLGVWGYAHQNAVLIEAARLDSSLSHPNQSCCDAVAAYSLAIASLVRTGGNRESALRAVNDWVRADACAEVQDWLELARQGEVVAYHPLAGFVKIAFIHAFRHLYAGSDYVAALTETLCGGGDTDTNACIVGGLIGAAVGIDGIPGTQREAVLSSDHSRGRNRPDFLHPREVPTLVESLVAHRP